MSQTRTSAHVLLGANTKLALAASHPAFGPKEALGKGHVAACDGPEAEDDAEATYQPGVDDALRHSLAQGITHHQPSIDGDELLRRAGHDARGLLLGILGHVHLLNLAFGNGISHAPSNF